MVWAYLKAAQTSEPGQFATSDFALYLGERQVWLKREMWDWQRYVAYRTKAQDLIPAERRPVLRYVPLQDIPWRKTKEGKRRLLLTPELPLYWSESKASLHWMLSAGATVYCSFETVPKPVHDSLIDSFASRTTVLQAPDMYDDCFDTRESKPRSENYGSVESTLRGQTVLEDLENVDVLEQSRFMLYYTDDNFSRQPLPPEYSSRIVGRFLWKLQRGICPQCDPGPSHTLDQMRIVQILPSAQGGNHSLINLELVCSRHAGTPSLVTDSNMMASTSILTAPADLSANEFRFLAALMSPRLQIQPGGFPLMPGSTIAARPP
jgi:hypothetical protein